MGCRAVSDVALLCLFAGTAAFWAGVTVGAWRLLNRKARQDGEQRLADWRRRERYVMGRRVR